MRILILCGVVGLALGLAAQWLPRAPGGESSANLVDDVRTRLVHSAGEVSQPTQVRVASGTTAPDEGVVVASGAGARRKPDSLAEVRTDEPAMSVPSSADLERDGVQQLISAGFTYDRAVEIVRRGSQLRREAIEREYAATGTIHALNSLSASTLEQQLRREMGDDEYEKFLRATGKTTRIRVGDVEPDSAAANAGILSGDEILAYAGRRVFNLRDLNALMLQTPEGETVKTTVVRDGQAMQLYVTGGALGIAQPSVR